MAAENARPEGWRVFIALHVPDAVRQRLQPPIDGLAPLRDWLRVSAIERIHLTLHFLGHLPLGQIEELTPRLAAVVQQHPRLDLSAQGVGAFPNLSRAQVLWAGIAGRGVPDLVDLQVKLGEVVRVAGLAGEDRFHPHLTLARVRRPIRGASRQLLGNWQERWRDVDFGEFEVGDVRLMRSELGKGPARYSVLATFSLQ